MTKSEISYEEVIDGELYHFDETTINKTLEGVLKSYRYQASGPKGPGHVYSVQTKNGEAVFFAPLKLNEKLQKIPLGSIVKIVYTGIKKTGSGNTMKLFTVQHAPATEANLKAVGVEIFKTVADEDKEANAKFDGE